MISESCSREREPLINSHMPRGWLEHLCLWEPTGAGKGSRGTGGRAVVLPGRCCRPLPTLRCLGMRERSSSPKPAFVLIGIQEHQGLISAHDSRVHPGPWGTATPRRGRGPWRAQGYLDIRGAPPPVLPLLSSEQRRVRPGAGGCLSKRTHCAHPRSPQGRGRASRESAPWTPLQGPPLT